MEANPRRDPLVAEVHAEDAAAFGARVERHRRELQVHCYRLLGSFEDAEDLVQEALLRAWRKRASFAGRSTFRAWLYRIATNACLDFLDRHPRRPSAPEVEAIRGLQPAATTPAEIAWLQPYLDRLLEPAAPGDEGPPQAAPEPSLIRAGRFGPRALVARDEQRLRQGGTEKRVSGNGYYSPPASVTYLAP